MNAGGRGLAALPQPRQHLQPAIAVGGLQPRLDLIILIAFMVSLPTRPSVPPVSKPAFVNRTCISCTSASVSARSEPGNG